MKKVLLIHTIVLLCSLEAAAQDCVTYAGEDIRICNYSTTLIGQPSEGNWLYQCQDSLAPINIVNVNDSTIFVTFSECGSYTFEYFINN